MAKDGSNIFFSLAATRVNGITDQSLSLVVDELEVTTKDSNGNKEFIAGEFSGTFTASGILEPNDTYGYEQMLTAMQAKAAVAWTYGEGIEVAGGELLSGNCIITGLDRQDTKNAPATWSGTFRITGAVTYGTSAATLA